MQKICKKYENNWLGTLGFLALRQLLIKNSKHMTKSMTSH